MVFNMLFNKIFYLALFEAHGKCALLISLVGSWDLLANFGQ